MHRLTTAPLFGCFKATSQRCLRLIYSDKKSSYENPLVRDNSVSVHHKNIQALAI